MEHSTAEDWALIGGQFLRFAGQLPDRILCSSAVRAIQTMKLAARAGRMKAETLVVPEIYGASGAAMEDVLRQRGEKAQRLLVCGHEPGCSELIARLCGASVEFPTAAMARIDFELERWDELAGKSGRLVWLLRPRTLADLA